MFISRLSINKLYVRLAISFSFLVFLLTMIIIMFIRQTYRISIIDENFKIAEKNISILANNLDTKLETIKYTSSSIKASDRIRQLINEYFTNERKKMLIDSEIQRILDDYKQVNDLVSKAIIIKGNEVMHPLYSMEEYKKDIVKNDQFVYYRSKKYFSMFSSACTVLDDYEKNNSILYFSQYLDNNNYKILGDVILVIKKNRLFADINVDPNNIFDVIFIKNRNGEIIYANETDEYVNKADNIIANICNDNKNKFTDDKGEKYVITNKVLDKTPEWEVVGVVSDKRIIKEINEITKKVIIIGLIFVAMFTILSFFIAKKITYPILLMKDRMKDLQQGLWPDNLNIKAQDELKELVHGFNEMTKNLKILINTIEKEKEEKKNIEIEKVRIELEALQYQINPHFIHNTLNTISGMALKEKNNDISELIDSFNLLLRKTMTTSREMYITINEEIKCIDSYLRILEYRYDIEIGVIYCIDDKIRNFKIPKLLLQPIVENSIFHGIIPKGYKGNVNIVFIQDDELIIKVIDDGVGISKGKLDLIFKENRCEKNMFNSIGLYNVNRRLNLYYGEKYRLNAYSRSGIGTSIQLKIPIIK